MYIYIVNKNGFSSSFDILGCFDCGAYFELSFPDGSHLGVFKSNISSFEIKEVQQ